MWQHILVVFLAFRNYQTEKVVEYLDVPYGRIYYLVINSRALWEALHHKASFIPYSIIFIIMLSNMHPFISMGFMLGGVGTKAQRPSFSLVIWFCLTDVFPFGPNYSMLTFLDRTRFGIIWINDLVYNIKWKYIIEYNGVFVPCTLE